MDLPAQVLVDDVWSQWKIRCVGAIHALAPVAPDRGHPTGSAVAAVLNAARKRQSDNEIDRGRSGP